MKIRLLYYEIIKDLKHKNALVITGMRQVGKSTLMKQIFDELKEEVKLWFDFDNPLDQKIFEDMDYNNIYNKLEGLSKLKKNRQLYVFLDEIQNFPEITKVIKFLIDHYKVKFIVTGSSNFYLRNLFPESLSGRKFLYNLYPLSFREYLYFKDKISFEAAKIKDISDILNQASEAILFKKFESLYEEYLNFGGFPEVVVTDDNDIKVKILRNIFSSFFEKDLKLLSDFKHIRELRDLILLLVPRVGCELDITKISCELQLDRAKVYSYLEFLQGTFFIKLLSKFSSSIDRTVAGGKKVYFCDNGILNVIGKVNEGQILENALVNQLLNYEDSNLNFYNKRNSAEIDIIFDKKIAFEIKSKGNEHDFDKLLKITKVIGIKKSYVISKSIRDFNQKNIVPAWIF